MSFQHSQLSAINCLSRLGKKFSLPEKGVLQKIKGCFLSLFVKRRRETAHPVPTNAFLKLSPDTDMLLAPFGYTHPPTPVLPHQRTLVEVKTSSSKSHNVYRGKVQCMPTKLLKTQWEPIYFGHMLQLLLLLCKLEHCLYNP